MTYIQPDKYYDVVPDHENYADSWFLGEPFDSEGRELDAREFRYGRSYRGPPPHDLPIDYEGRRIAFNLAAFDMPVVTSEIADIIEEIAPDAVERFPLTIASIITGYEILNVIQTVACVDEERTYVMRWTPEDGRPDKVGRYRMLGHLTIDPERARGHDIFRVHDWEVALIVSDRIRAALEPIPELGILFEPVTGNRQ